MLLKPGNIAKDTHHQLLVYIKDHFKHFLNAGN